jgi:hypothetical protein
MSAIVIVTRWIPVTKTDAGPATLHHSTVHLSAGASPNGNSWRAHVVRVSENASNYLILQDLAVRVGFEPRDPIENTQVIDSEISENA